MSDKMTILRLTAVKEVNKNKSVPKMPLYNQCSALYVEMGTFCRS